MIELTKGQEWVLAGADEKPLTRLTLGLGWDKLKNAGFIASGAPDVDLDASVVEFAGDQLFDLSFYNNLATRDGAVIHQGDNTSGRGEGDDETVEIDLGKVYAKVDTLALLVSSYQGHALEWINNAYCRFTDDTGTEVARYTLTGGVPETGVLLAKLGRTGDGWTLRAVGEGVDVKVPADAVSKLRRFLG